MPIYQVEQTIMNQCRVWRTNLGAFVLNLVRQQCNAATGSPRLVMTSTGTRPAARGQMPLPWNVWHLSEGRSVWVWHNMYGRPRSLRPWNLAEATLPFEQPEQVRLRSLGERVERLNRIFIAYE